MIDIMLTCFNMFCQGNVCLFPDISNLKLTHKTLCYNTLPNCPPYTLLRQAGRSMQVFRTGKTGRADRGGKVLTCRGKVGKKTGGQAGLGPKKDQKDKQAQDRHYRHTFWMST